jgi:hypothetical protein
MVRLWSEDEESSRTVKDSSDKVNRMHGRASKATEASEVRHGCSGCLTTQAGAIAGADQGLGGRRRLCMMNGISCSITSCDTLRMCSSVSISPSFAPQWEGILDGPLSNGIPLALEVVLHADRDHPTARFRHGAIRDLLVVVRVLDLLLGKRQIDIQARDFRPRHRVDCIDGLQGAAGIPI